MIVTIVITYQNSSQSSVPGRWQATNFTPSFPRANLRFRSGLLNCCQTATHTHAENMKSRKKMKKRSMETDVISGVKRLTGEKRMLGLAKFRERQQPRSKGEPSCASSTFPTLRKKEVILFLLLYWSLRSQRLIFSETSSSRWKLISVNAYQTEEMLLHCNWPLLSEKEHSMVSVQRLVQRSYFMRQGRMTNWDSALRVALKPEKGMLKQSHFDPFSLANTTFDTGSTHCDPSADVSMVRSQNLTPFLYPLAFCSSKPPNCILNSFPPGAEQKLTMSYLKYYGVCDLISWQM